MATLTQLSTSNLALKGAGDEYNYINRFFATKAEADAALADSSWAPVAGKLNACLTGDQGLLVYNETTSSLDLADAATRAYIDSQLAALTGDAPQLMDTLGEISDALNDNPNYFTDAAAATAANTALINAESGRAVAAENAIQADVDQNEADADAAIAAVQADVDQNEADSDAAIAAENAAMLAAVAVVQADVDQNESDADSAIAAVQADVDANEAAALAARNTIQADVDANEATALAARNAIQADVDANEVDRRAVVDIQSNITSVKNAVRGTSIEVGNNIALHPAAGGRVEVEGDLLLDNQTDVIDGAGVTLTSFTNINAYDGRLTTLEADPTTAAAVAAVQADVDANEAASIASLALKAPLNSPALTGTPTSPTASQGAGTTQIATTAYVDTAVANLIDSSPGALDTLNELAAAIGDDANFSTTITNSIAAVQSDVNQNELDADNAIAALQADVDQNEADADAAIAAVQADVDANEVTAAGLVTAENTAMLAAVAVVQADVDQNETDGDAADAALGVRIDTVETEIDTARTNIYTALGRTEGATNLGTFTGSVLSDNSTVRALLQELETDTESRLSKLGGTLTGNLTLRKSDGSAVALELSRADHADMNVVWKVQPSYVSADKEVLTVLANGQVVAHFDERQRFAINMNDPDYTLDVGGDGHFSTNLVVGGTLTLGSTAVTSTAAELNILDGVTSTAAELNILDGVTSTATELNLLDGVTATTTEINYIDVAAVGTAEASKALVLDAGKSIAGINQLTCVDLTVTGTQTTVDTVTMQATNAIAFEGATADSNETTLTIIDPDADRTIKLPNQSGCLPVLAADSNTAITSTPEELNILDGVTATTAELNYVDGVTSNIQTQLNAIQADVDGNESDADTAIAANETHIDNLATLSGVAKDAVNLGTFTGSTISDNRTSKQALQELETAIESNDTLIDNLGGGITSAAFSFSTTTTGGSIPAGYIRFNNATPANVTEIYISVETKAGVDISNVIPELFHDNSRIFIQVESDHTKFIAASVNGSLTDNTTYFTIPVDGINAGNLPSLNHKVQFAVIGEDLSTLASASVVTEIDGNVNDLITLSGVAENAANLGAFTGATINDNVTVKAALQALETAQEATQADVDQNESDADAAIAAVLAGTSIPGPYNNDSDAASNSVAVGAIYKNANGTIHWRVS